MIRARSVGPGLKVRPRAFALLVVAGGLVFGAILFRTPVPLFAALPLVLLPVAVAAGRPAPPGPVDIAWSAEGLGPVLNVTGSLTGRFEAGAADVRLLPPPFPGATLSAPPRLERGPERIGFTFAWTLSVPLIGQLECPQVVWRDPLGLYDQVLDGAGPPLTVERYPPELHRLDSVHLDRTLQLPGEVRSRRIGPSGEFFGIRGAAPDEPLRQINWRASARVGRWLANDFQIDRTGDLLLLLDARPTPLGPVADERLLGVARAGVFGIAESLLRGKVRVGFASFGEFVQAVPLSTGRVHRIRIERAVLETRRSAVAGPPDRCTYGLRRYFRPGTTTLLVSAWEGDAGYHLLPFLRRAGFPSVLVSPSPLPLRRPAASGEPDLEATIVARLEQAERRARLASLWEHGPVVDWNDYWSLDGLVRFLKRPSRRRVS